VRRDIQIVSAARIDEGFITVRVRTSNVLYVSKGLSAKPDFEPAKDGWEVVSTQQRGGETGLMIVLRRPKQ